MLHRCGQSSASHDAAEGPGKLSLDEAWQHESRSVPLSYKQCLPQERASVWQLLLLKKAGNIFYEMSQGILKYVQLKKKLKIQYQIHYMDKNLIILFEICFSPFLLK